MFSFKKYELVVDKNFILEKMKSDLKLKFSKKLLSKMQEKKKLFSF